MSWYVGMGHDPEVPAGYQDADIEIAELREAAAEVELVVFTRGDTVRYQSVAAWIVDPDGGIGPVIRMVGDDRDFEVYPEELEHIDRDEFCGGCGQIGCGHG